MGREVEDDYGAVWWYRVSLGLNQSQRERKFRHCTAEGAVVRVWSAPTSFMDRTCLSKAFLPFRGFSLSETAQDVLPVETSHQETQQSIASSQYMAT